MTRNQICTLYQKINACKLLHSPDLSIENKTDYDLLFNRKDLL